MKPTPNSVEYSLSASLKVPAGVTVKLKPMTLSLYTPDTGPKDPYITVTLPEYHLHGKTTVNITNQTAEILDKSQFIDFLQSAVNADSFKISAYGKTAAYLGALKADITLNKKVDMTGKIARSLAGENHSDLFPGLNNLTGFSFATAAVVLPPESDGTNLKGSVVMPNPSIVTFELVRTIRNVMCPTKQTNSIRREMLR
jgi:hypothetical protein